MLFVLQPSGAVKEEAGEEEGIKDEEEEEEMSVKKENKELHPP